MEVNRCHLCAKGISSLGCWRLYAYLVYSPSVKGNLEDRGWEAKYFLESNNPLPPSQFSYRRGLGTCEVLLTLSHSLQDALDSDIEGRLVQLDISAAFYRGSYCDLFIR